MRGLYRYTVCKRNIQQRARTDRPLFAPLSFGGGALEGRAGRASAAGRPAGRRRPGREICFPACGWPALPDRWTGPGGTRTDEPREKAPFPRFAAGPQGSGRAGGRRTTRPKRGVRPTRRSGFYRNTLRPAPAGESRRSARAGPRVPLRCGRLKDSYLVDPASSHMLVSKIKPCMSKYNLYTGKLRMAH